MGGGGGSGPSGVRVDVNGEVKFFVKIQKTFLWGVSGRGGGGMSGWGVRVDVNREVKFW